MASPTTTVPKQSSINYFTRKTNQNSSDTSNEYREKFNLQLMHFYNQQTGSVKKPWTEARVSEVISYVKTSREAMDSGIRRTPMQYYWASKYDLVHVGDEEYLILKKKASGDPIVHVIPIEKYYDLLSEIHKETGHGGRDKILSSIKNKFYIQKKAIEIFLSLCPTCGTKRNLPKKGMEPESNCSKDFNTRAQFDLIDLQSVQDGPFKWLLICRDLTTKFIQLRPLRTKQSSEVALELIKIFLVFGPPLVLQSDSDQEFTAKVIADTVKMWPECKIEYGCPRDLETEVGSERVNQDTENALHTWMRDNNSTKWSIGCYFIQYQNNTLFHRVIGKTPYRAVFCCDSKLGIQSTNIPENILTCFKTEEDLEQSFHIDTSISCKTDAVMDSQIQQTMNFNYSSKNPTIYPLSSTNYVDKNIEITENYKEDLSTPDHDFNSNKQEIQKINVASVNTYSNVKTEVIEINIDGFENDENTNISRNETIQNFSTCLVCGDSTNSALQCFYCFNPVHDRCGVHDGIEGDSLKILCLLCSKELKSNKTEHAHHGGNAMALQSATAREQNVIDNGYIIDTHTHQSVNENNESKKKFHIKLIDFYNQQSGIGKKPWTSARVLEVISHIKTSREAIDSGIRRTSTQYYWTSKYDILQDGNDNNLILKKKASKDPTIHVIPLEKYYDLLMDIHKETGHGGRDKMVSSIKNRFYIPKKAIEIFVSLCPFCELKRSVPKKVIEPKPTISKDFNTRAQVNLIDLQSVPDGPFKWLLNYQDHSTKFIQLRPLRTKLSSEIALELVKIFLVFGPPLFLQSDNGQEFIAEVIEDVVSMWPACKIVQGNSKKQQPQCSGESSNQNIENALRTWMRENNSTKWSIGCHFVQYQKNCSYHKLIGRAPYSTVFGCDPNLRMQSANIEEDLDQIPNIEPSDNYDKVSNSQIQNSMGFDIASENITSAYHLTTINNVDKDKKARVSDSKDVSTKVTHNQSDDLVQTEHHVKIELVEDMDGFESNENIYISSDETIHNDRCLVCEKSSSGALQCFLCLKPVHATCGLSYGTEGGGLKLLCLLCSKESNISNKKEHTLHGVKRAAETVVNDKSKKLAGTTSSNLPKV